MSKKRKSYSADFKAKLVLEVLEGEKTINEIASAYEVGRKCRLCYGCYITKFIYIILEIKYA